MGQLQLPREKRSPVSPPGAVREACVTTRCCRVTINLTLPRAALPAPAPLGVTETRPCSKRPHSAFHRLVEWFALEGSFEGHPVQYPWLWAKILSTRSSSSRAPSNLTLNVSTDGAPTTTCTAKNFFLIYNLNVLFIKIIIIFPVATGPAKRFVTFLWALLIYWKVLYDLLRSFSFSGWTATALFGAVFIGEVLHRFNHLHDPPLNLPQQVHFFSCVENPRADFSIFLLFLWVQWLKRKMVLYKPKAPGGVNPEAVNPGVGFTWTSEGAPGMRLSAVLMRSI